MGYDLTSESGDWCYFNVSMWYWVLALAFAFGWRPAGTAAPTINEGLEECDPDPNWDGTNYFTNSHQAVIELDARAIGEALHRALETTRKAKEGDLEARADLDQRLAEATALTRPSDAVIARFAPILDRFKAEEDEPTEPVLFDPWVADKIKRIRRHGG
jgi:hypothetical protein